MGDAEKIHIGCIVKKSLNSHIYDFLSNTISDGIANTFLQDINNNNNNGYCNQPNCNIPNSVIQKANLLEEWQTFWHLLNNNNNSNNNINFPSRGFNSIPQQSELELLPLMATSLENESMDSNHSVTNSNNKFNNTNNNDSDHIILQNTVHSHIKNNKIPMIKSSSLNETISSQTMEKDTNEIILQPQPQVVISNNSNNTIKFENVSFANALESNFEGSISSHYNASPIPKVNKKINKTTKSKKSSKFNSPFTGSFQTTGWIKQYADNTINKPIRKKSNKKNTPTSLESHSRRLEFNRKNEYSQRSNSVSSSNCSSATTPSVSSLSSFSKSKSKSKKISGKSPMATNNNNNNKNSNTNNSNNSNENNTIATPQVDSVLDSIDYAEMANSNVGAKFIQETNNHKNVYSGYHAYGSNPEEHSYMETLLYDTIPFDEHMFASINLNQFSTQSSNSEVDLNSTNHRKSDSSKVSSE
ncbi:hypothetical protein, no similarity [Maudiozyma saulgeensis]|uniref:Uncharacterized protein n=1 Tax=Maudiozyma saulgeensis TaxID=1789683 RepID=A0A1X7QXR8_9SACH|nr:hypothetical protein, no similarity [Kazachstania saulgeensis]